MVSWLSLLLGTSLGAGANAYLTLLAVGMYARFGDAAPEAQEAVAPFGSYWVIVPAGVLFLVEFCADKVPALDNLWDALHTVVRPAAAVFIALTLARDVDVAYQALAGVGAGSLALGAHGLKAGIRGLARLNPEPASNALSSSALSLAEDLSVAGLLVLVFVLPGLALVLIGAIMVVMVVVGPRLARLAIFAFRAAGTRLLSPFLGGRGGGRSVGSPPPGLVVLLRQAKFDAQSWDGKDEAGLQRQARGVRGGAASRRGEAQGSKAPRASDGPPDPKDAAREEQARLCALSWGRCYLDRGLVDLRPGFLFIGDDTLAIAYRGWLRRRLRTVEREAMRGAVVTRGPLVCRVALDTADGEAKILLLASEKVVIGELLKKLEAWGVPIGTGKGIVACQSG